MKSGKNFRMTLQRRLQLYFVFYIIIPILALGIMMYFVTLKSAEQSAIKFSNQIINRISSEIEDMLYASYNVSALVSEEPFIQENLRNPLSEDLPTLFSADLAIDSRLSYISSYNESIFGIYLIAENGGKYKSNYTTVREGDLRKTDWYKKVINSSEVVWFGTHYESYATETSGKSMVSLGFPVKDKASGNNMGVVIVDIEEAMLSEMINSEIGSDGIIFILDENNKVISHPDRAMISNVIDIDSKNTTIQKVEGNNIHVSTGNNKSIIIYKTLPMNSWKVVAALPTHGLTEDIDQVWDFIFVSLGIIIAFSLIASWTISNNIVNPIGVMMRLMKKVEEGNLDVSMALERNDEIGDLSNSFNQMIFKVKALMNAVYDEQKKLRVAELQALQTQINPHFLYNTLATIIWMAREKEYDEIIKIVTAITKYYRTAISRGRDIIMIEEEVEHIRSYLVILKHRYSDQFDYDIDIPATLYKYKTLKLILQPIIENAIYHGVKNSRGKGHISIRGEEIGEEMVFHISDTGVGMTAEKLLSLKKAINEYSGEHTESYGLRNVNERIKIFFGREYGIEIDSTEGVGTDVQVKIPKMME